MQGNATVLSKFHSLKGLITSGKIFDRIITQQLIDALNNLKIFLKFLISRILFSQKSFLSWYTVMFIYAPSGRHGHDPGNSR